MNAPSRSLIRQSLISLAAVACAVSAETHAASPVCQTYVESLALRNQLAGSRHRIYNIELPHGSDKPADPEHVADLLDSDFIFENVDDNQIGRPFSDPTKVFNVPPLGDHPVDRFETIEISGVKMSPVSIFSMPDSAASVTVKGAYVLERFSRTLDGSSVRPFSIVMSEYGPGSLSDPGLINSVLRMMRARANFNDEQLADYGIQFALRLHGRHDTCRTLSYARDKQGKVGLVYTDGIGNFDSPASNAGRVAAYGASIQRKAWHPLRVPTSSAIRVAVTPELESVGLVSVLEQDHTMVTRTVIYDLLVDQFEQTGPNTLPFREVARECTRLIGIQNYDAYQKRNDGTYPRFYEALVGCMTNSNFRRVRSARIHPMRTVLNIGDAIGEKSFYVRKLRERSEARRFERYAVDDLLVASQVCSTVGTPSVASMKKCLEGRSFELMATDAVLPRPMFHLVERAVKQ